MKLAFIYGLRCPLTGLIRYIGKCDNPQKRLSQHLSDHDKNHRTTWIVSLKSQGLKPALEVIAEVEHDNWQFWERSYIRLYRCLGFALVNGTAGGDGFETGQKHTPASRAKMSASHTGKKQTPEHRKACGKGRLGKKHTAETLAKISAASRGRKISLETRAKLSVALSGKKHCSETRVRMSLSKLGLKYKNNKSGFSGVCRNKQRDTWRSYLRFDGKSRALGSYPNLEDAVFVRALAVDKYYGNCKRRFGVRLH